MTRLRHAHTVPPEFLSCHSRELADLLGGPTLFELEGKRSPPLFVSVLQHGNEPTGLEAVQQVLKKYLGKGLPRALWLFVGNVDAASMGERVLAGQLDYNRAWPGTNEKECLETQLMSDLVRTVTQRPLFASVDLHNNTGCNPHYGCINRLEPSFMHLASMFSRTCVYFTQPRGVQSLAFAPYCPSVTLECGQAGEQAALSHAVEFLDMCLHMQALPETPVPIHDIHVLHTIAVAKVRPGISFGFGGEGGVGLCLRPDLDRFNFGLLPKGESLGVWRGSGALPVQIVDNDGRDVSTDYLAQDGGQLRLVCDLIPSMATLDANVIRQDCLFYVMEEMN